MFLLSSIEAQKKFFRYKSSFDQLQQYKLIFMWRALKLILIVRVYVINKELQMAPPNQANVPRQNSKYASEHIHASSKNKQRCLLWGNYKLRVWNSVED